MKRAIVDANVVLGHLVRSEDQLEDALKIYDELFLSTQVVFEVIFVLDKQYKLTRLKICSAVLEILQHSKIQSERLLLINTLFKYRSDFSLSLVDCYLWELAESMDCDILTKDRQLIKKATKQ